MNDAFVFQQSGSPRVYLFNPIALEKEQRFQECIKNLNSINVDFQTCEISSRRGLGYFFEDIAYLIYNVKFENNSRGILTNIVPRCCDLRRSRSLTSIYRTSFSVIKRPKHTPSALMSLSGVISKSVIVTVYFTLASAIARLLKSNGSEGAPAARRGIAVPMSLGLYRAMARIFHIPAHQAV